MYSLRLSYMSTAPGSDSQNFGTLFIYKTVCSCVYATELCMRLICISGITCLSIMVILYLCTMWTEKFYRLVHWPWMWCGAANFYIHWTKSPRSTFHNKAWNTVYRWVYWGGRYEHRILGNMCRSPRSGYLNQWLVISSRTSIVDTTTVCTVWPDPHHQSSTVLETKR